MPAPPLSAQVGSAASLLGLFLALVTLFTTEQARRLADEHQREGGADSGRVRIVRCFSIGLAAATAASIALLIPLVVDVLDAIGSNRWEPVLGVFLLTYLLLIALLVWQIWLAVRAR